LVGDDCELCEPGISSVESGGSDAGVFVEVVIGLTGRMTLWRR
jgi:hypothetical protein